MTANPRHCGWSEAIQTGAMPLSDRGWIAASPAAPRNDERVRKATPRTPLRRHCERSEAIQRLPRRLRLLAMTVIVSPFSPTVRDWKKR